MGDGYDCCFVFKVKKKNIPMVWSGVVSYDSTNTFIRSSACSPLAGVHIVIPFQFYCTHNKEM